MRERVCGWKNISDLYAKQWEMSKNALKSKTVNRLSINGAKLVSYTLDVSHHRSRIT